MSSQSAKKKRLGSRRQAPTQKAKPEDVDFHVAEGSSLAQSCKPEGNTETLDVLANLNESPSETPSPPSAELTENRRKLGSSRRSKRAQHSEAADLHHREEAEEKTSNDQPLQTTQLLVAMQPQKQEELSQRNEPSVSAMHDSSLYSSDGYFSEPTAVNSPEAVLHVLQSEQLKENADAADVLTSVLSSPSSEVPFTDQSNQTTMPEELPQVFLADKEDSGLLRHDGKLQNLDSESHLKPEVTEFLSTSGAPAVSTSERSPEVNIHLEYCDEKEVFSSQLKEFPQSEEQSEHLSFQVHDAHYPSEDAAKNAHKQEDNLTQMEEVSNSSESVTRGTTENSEMLLRNLVDGAEASDSFESASKQEDYIIKDTALGQINEVDRSEDDDTTLNAEQRVDQQSEGILSDSEVSNESLQTLKSDSQPTVNSDSQESDTYLNPIGNRRKIGSSRRYKERQHAKESVAETSHTPAEDVENIRETMLEKLSKVEEIQFDQFEENTNVETHVGIAEFTTLSSLSSSPVEQHLAEGSNSMEMAGNELPHMNPVRDADSNERDKDVESLQYGGNLKGYVKAESHVTLEDMAESSVMPEVSTEKSKPEPECKAGQVMMSLLKEQKLPAYEGQNEIISSSEAKVDHLSNDINSGPEKAVNEDSYPDEEKEHPTEESNSQTSERTTEDYHVSVTKEVEITGLESVGTALNPVYEIKVQVQDDKILSGEQTAHRENESILSVLESSDCSSETQPSEVQPLSDSQPQQDDPNFHPTMSRRKLGSSRRNKGRQYLKESVTESASEGKEETAESTESVEALPVTHDSSLYSEVMQSYSSEDHKPTELNNPEPNLGVLVPENKNLQQTQDEKGFEVEVSGKTEEAMLEETDKSDTPQPEEISSESAHHSEAALNKMHNQEVDPTQTHEANNSLENVTHDVMGQIKLTAKNTDGSAPKQENVNSDDKNHVHLTKESNPETLDRQNEHYLASVTKELKISDREGVNSAFSQLYTVEGLVEDDVKLSTEQTTHQEKEKVLSEPEESESSVHTIIQSETSAVFDFQSLDNPVSTEELIHADFNPTGNRRKLGSSRRNKGRQHAIDSASKSQRPNEEVVENTMDNEQPKATKNFSTNKTVVLGKSVEMEIWVDEMALTDSNAAEFPEQAIHVGIPESTSSNLHSTTDQLRSNSSKIPQDEVPYMTSEAENENLDCTFLVTELHLGSEDLEASVKLEASTERHSPGECKEPECSIEQATMSTTEKQEIGHFVTSDISTGKHSPEKHTDIEPSVEQAAGLTPDQQQECANLAEAEIRPHSEDVLSIVSEDTIKPTQVEERGQTKPSSFKESEFPLQNLQSDVAASLDLYPQDSSVGIEQPTQTSFSTTGTRRKLGSSRRNKARQYVRDANDATHNEPGDKVVEMAMNEKSFETTKMSLVTETARQEELMKQTELDPNPTQEIRKIQSTVNDEDTILSQNVMDESEVMPTNINSSSGKDDAVKSNKDTNEGAIKLIKEPENLARPDPLEFESLQSQDDSETQSMACRDGNFSPISVTVDVLEQGDANLIQQTEVVSYDKDSVEEEMTVQLPNNVVDTARDTAVNDCRSEVESSTDAQVLKVGENFEKKDEEAQEMNISQKFTAAGPFFTAQDKNDASVPSAQSGIPPTSSNPQEIQGQSNFSCHENLQHYSKQKKRKMGSTRRNQLRATGEQEEALYSQAPAPESDFTLQADVQKVDKTETVKESPKTAVVSEDLNPKKATADEGQQLQSSASEPRSSLVTDKDVGTVVLSVHSACHNKDVTNNGTPEGSFMSVCESSQSTPKEDDRQESESVIQEQALKSTETPNVAAADLKVVQSEIREGTGEEHADVRAGMQDPNAKKSLEMKNASPKLNSANPRRKMGSTRRNLISRDKKEDLQQEREVDSEVNVGDIKAETSGTEGDSEQTQQKVYETVESSYTGESYLKPPSAHSFEESPVSHDQPVETEPPVPSIIPSTSPKHDVVTETASGGRRRKLGSHRRSRRSPGNENQTENGDRTMDTQGVVHETGIKTTEEEPLGLDRIPETDESSRQPTSIISTPTAAAHLKTEGAEAPVKVSPVKQTSPNIRLGQDSQQAFSLGAAPRSSSYNVLMVGDSSVGKTSFMRRAQSGKFALDLPASVGLDSCRWTVVVDGKPVVLQVWDTAGQERFHSITRQVFHKAQAFILMYDITSCQSFSAISYWADCIQEGAAENVTILLVGNKSDRAERQVKAHEGENIAKEYDFEFMECSAATGENVIECLETVARMLSQRVDTRVDSTVLHKEPQQKKSSGCC